MPKIPLNQALLSRVLTQPWAMRRETLLALTQLIITPSDATARPRMDAQRTSVATRIVTGYDGVTREQHAAVGYLPLNYEAWNCAEQDSCSLPPLPPNTYCVLVWGMLGRAWTSDESWYYDAVEVDELTASVESTPEGSTVVLWFRSPGGVITGIPETATALRAALAKRRIVAFTDDLCASAAYWLAAQCSQIFCTPTANVGSIGVYVAFYDWTEFLSKAGVKLELFKAGTYKAMGLTGNPLSRDESALIQSGVDDCYTLFTRDVLRNRELQPETMQGQCFSGKAVLDNNLCDGFYNSAAAFFAAIGKGKI